MRPKRYVGVTGFMCAAEVKAVMDGVTTHSPDRSVMIGLLVSNRTLRGETNKWPTRYPKPEALGEIFSEHGNTLNLLHFNTNEPENLLKDMQTAQQLAGPRCHGFQLNMAWPETKVLSRYKNSMECENRTIVLQCGKRALDEVDRSARQLARRVAGYAGLVDYVLVDPSGGLGQDFDPIFVRHCFGELTALVPEIGLAVAGGLSVANIGKIESFLEDYPDCSTDVESGVRTAHDNLDISETINYIEANDELYQMYTFGS